MVHYLVTYESCRGKNGVPQVFMPCTEDVPEETWLVAVLHALDDAARQKHPRRGINSFDPKDYRLEFCKEIPVYEYEGPISRAEQYKLWDAR